MELWQAEGQILLFIQENMRNAVLTPVMQFITSLGNAGIFWIVLTLVLLAWKKTRFYGLCSLYALVCSYLINNLALKNLVARTRPYELVEGLELITRMPDDYSFPSGHSAASFASAVALLKTFPKEWKKWGVCLVVLAGLIAFSRLYVGVHFPTDVLFGILSGTLCGLLGAWLGKRTIEARQRHAGM